MKNLRFYPPALNWAAILLLISARLVLADGISLAGYTSVVPGVDYLHVTDTNYPWSIHIARLDRAHPEFELIATHAKNEITALGTVVSQVESLGTNAGKAIVAVNADFFVIAKGPYQGDPRGLQVINGELSSAPMDATFWTEPKGEFHVGKVTSQFTVKWPNGKKSHLALNESRATNGPGVVLFTPRFGTSTRTTNGLEFVLEAVPGKPWLPLRVDQDYVARVREVHSFSDTAIAADTMVISIAPEMAAQCADIHPGDKLKISTDTSPDVQRAVYAVGGRPVLMEHGRSLNFPADKTAKKNLAPRTAIGWNKKYFYFMVVDGRQKDLSMGMTFGEMAEFMKQLGCTDALNLDGGGSTTFWLDGKVLNSPSDKHLRTVANALILVKH